MGGRRRWISIAVAALCASTLVGAPQRADAFAVVGGPALEAGHDHTLTLRADGTVWAFGDNTLGQLGVAANGTPNPTPTQVGSLTNITALASGLTTSYALRADGTVWAFGVNDYGQLGNPTNAGTIAANSPTQVAGLSRATAVAAGAYHALILRADGTVWSFGYNEDGELGRLEGLGTTDPVPTAQQVPGLTGIVAIAAGTYHSLALGADGTVWGFGYDVRGQLGGTGGGETPTRISGLTDITAISAGGAHTLALRRDGAVLALGSNEHGQLGTVTNLGTTTSNPTPMIVSVPGASPVVQVAAGSDHTLLRRADGSVWATGANTYGQTGLDNGFVSAAGAVEQIPDLVATEVSAGNRFSLVRRSDGTIVAFGYNERGQLALPAGTAPRLPSATSATADVPVAATRLVVVTPARVLDTRPASRINHTGDKPAAGSTTTVTVRGRAGVPADAVAITGNLTAVDATAPGYVQALPSTSGTLRGSSNLNVETAAQTIANAVTIPLGTDGGIRLYTESGTHLLLDITGYYIPATGPTAGGRTIPATAPRLLDTRGGTKPAAGSTQRLVLATGSPVPSDAAAVILNVTAVDADAAGFVQVGPAGALTPYAWSNLNIGGSGTVVPNQVIVAVGTGGAIDLFTERSTHLLVDLAGYVTSDAQPVGTDGLFVPITPTRSLDTRGGTKPQAGSLTSNDPGALGIVPPAGTGAVAVPLTIVDATGAGFVQAAATGALVPGASSVLNASRSGQVVPNAAMVRTTGSSFDLYTEAGTHLLVDVFGYFTN